MLFHNKGILLPGLIIFLLLNSPGLVAFIFTQLLFIYSYRQYINFIPGDVEKVVSVYTSLPDHNFLINILLEIIICILISTSFTLGWIVLILPLYIIHIMETILLLIEAEKINLKFNLKYLLLPKLSKPFILYMKNTNTIYLQIHATSVTKKQGANYKLYYDRTNTLCKIELSDFNYLSNDNIKDILKPYTYLSNYLISFKNTSKDGSYVFQYFL